ncbi:MAG: DUF362 domain-containing protein [Candidatus Woesearchaeota archaeon]
MSEVIFFQKEDMLGDVLQQELKHVFSKGEPIAVKLHFGEPGNKTAVSPMLVKMVVDVLKAIGCKPFLFDSLVMYSSPRNNVEGYKKVAKERGFYDLGCPVVITDDFIEVKGKDLVFQVCKPLAEAEGVLVLSHVKGHICTGFGGAIKNLGMGAVTKKTKADIHTGGEPIYDSGCTLCGACAEHCPNDNVRFDGQPFFDKNWCCGCSNCSIFCPHGSTVVKVDTFDYSLAEGAQAALSKFKKVYFVNVAKDITKLCDCVSDPGKPIMDDIGFILGKDIVAVEKATHDLIVEKAGRDIFEEIHHKSPLVHIKEAEKLGMGNLRYSTKMVS